MPTKIATLLQEFGARIGLGSQLRLGNDKTIRLNLEKDFGIDFEEDTEKQTLWIYIELLPGRDITQTSHLPELLKIMFRYHRSSDARLIINANGYQLMLASGFVLPTGDLDSTLLDLFEEHMKTVIGIAEALRRSLCEPLSSDDNNEAGISAYQQKV